MDRFFSSPDTLMQLVIIPARWSQHSPGGAKSFPLKFPNFPSFVRCKKVILYLSPARHCTSVLSLVLACIMVIPTRSSPPRTRRRANLKRSPSPDYASVGDIDTEMPDIDPEPPQKFAFIVALDYGTTYTSVSYFKFDPDDRPNDVNIPEIQTIQAWPHACGGTKASNKAEVPSESWYANGQHYWGFQALKERRKPSFRRDSAVGLGFCPKNVLSGNDEDENSRLELKNTLATIGKKETDIVTDYLMQVLLHTKRELRDIEGYNEICDVELVLCVPAAWDATARRDWQEIMGEVSERAQFGSIYNFWMIHEPEAAAAMVLESETRLGTGVTRIKWNKVSASIVL